MDSDSLNQFYNFLNDNGDSSSLDMCTNTNTTNTNNKNSDNIGCLEKNSESKNLLNVSSENFPPPLFNSNDSSNFITSAATLEVSSNTIINNRINNNNNLIHHDSNLDINIHVNKKFGKDLTRRKRSSNDEIQMEYHFNPLYIISDQNNSSVSTSNTNANVVEVNPHFSSTPYHDPNTPILDQVNLHQLYSPPSDKYGLIYVALLLAGIGFLLPYNSFMIAVDYFQQRFPNTEIVFDMSTTYILFAFLTVIVQNFFVESIPIFWRLNLGYLLSFIFMLFVVIYEIWAELGNYWNNLLVISIISIGCTIQQSTFYGYTSMLPKRYVQAVMTGESAAGILVSMNRIITKILYPNDPEYNTVLFFSMSIVVILICAIVHIILLPRSDFIRYHIFLCNQQPSNDGARIMHQINENVGLVNMYHEQKDNNNRNHDNNSKIVNQRSSIFSTESNPALLDNFDSINHGATTSTSTITNRNTNVQNILRTDSTEFVLPFGIDDEEIFVENICSQSPNKVASTATTTRDGDSMNTMNSSMNHSDYSISFKSVNRRRILLRWLYAFETWTSFLHYSRRFVRRLRECDKSITRLILILNRKYFIRKNIVRLIWPYIASIMLVYFVTLTIFPGIESEIYSCRYGDWFPIILMATFNLMDFIGKLMSTLFYRIERFQLLSISILRFLLIPLFAFSITPRENPFFANPFWPILFSMILGLTNGIFGSLPMILAPFKVNEQMREITGNLMTFSYIIGLTSGSFASYILNDWINNTNANNDSIINLNNDYWHKYCFNSVILIDNYTDNIFNDNNITTTIMPSMITTVTTTITATTTDNITIIQ